MTPRLADRVELASCLYLKGVENGIGVPHSAGNLAYVWVQSSSIYRPYVALQRQRWKHHVEIICEVGKMNAARSRVAHLQHRIPSNALLNIEVPLHVIAAGWIRLNIRVAKRGRPARCLLRRKIPELPPRRARHREHCRDLR
jgi:hypothetical protein